MAEITAALVKELRDKTNAGMMECKNALKETSGDVDAAIKFLRERGAIKAAKKADREAKEGVVAAQIDVEARSGVLVEVNCETCLLYTSPSPRDATLSRMPSSA